MIVLIDIGNTRIKLGVQSTLGAQRLPLTHAYTHHDIQDIRRWLAQLTPPITHAYGVSVADPHLRAQMDVMLAEYGVQIAWQSGASTAAAIHNGYQVPAQLGADRWVSAIGLSLRSDTHKRSFVHASFGTATTVDTIRYLPTEKKHSFVGGIIFPGPHMMATALATNTAQLVVGEGHISAFPTDTQTAIASGIHAAQVGAVLHQWQQSTVSEALPPLLIISGGASDSIQHALGHAFQLQHPLPPPVILWHDTPALDGLAHLASINTSSYSVD